MFKSQLRNPQSPFTLIEMMFVVAILSIIMGMFLPTLGKGKFKARFVRWVAYNAGLNRYPETVINYNFIDQNFKVDYDGEIVNALRNGAEGCTLDGFDIKSYHGVLKNGLEWFPRNGRWGSLNNSLYFDGINDYVEVPGTKVLSFHPATDDFTVSMWVKFKDLKNLEVLVSKSRWPDYSQCVIYRNKKEIEVELGKGNIFTWNKPEIKTGQWYHLAFVNIAEENVQMYLNGEEMTEKSEKGGGKKKSKLEETIETDSILNQAKLLIGAAGMDSNPNPRYFFNGQMDELVFIRQALTSAEIRGIYQMENSD